MNMYRFVFGRIGSFKAPMLLFWLMLNCVCLRAGGRLASHWPATVKECDSIVYMLEQGSGYASERQGMLVRRLYDVSRKHPGNKAVRWRALYWDAVDKNDRMMPALADSLLGAAVGLVDSVAYEYDYRRIRAVRHWCACGLQDRCTTFTGRSFPIWSISSG